MAELELVHNVHVRCDACDKKQKVDKENFDYDVAFLEERGMGDEFEHDFTCDIECKKCGNLMSIKIIGYEYPEGALNAQDAETSGCELAEEPVLDFKMEYEFDYPFDTEERLLAIVNDATWNIEMVANDPESVYDLSPSEFEDLVAEVFRRKGFEVVVTPRTRDGGKDIIATYNMSGIPCMIIIECKKYSKKNKVGVGIVRSLHGVQTKEHYGKAVVVTSSSFSKEAQDFTNDMNDMMILIDFQELMDMVNSVRDSY